MADRRELDKRHGVNRTCAGCKHYKPEKSAPDVGHCLRYPPKSVDYGPDGEVEGLPYTRADHTCGEWHYIKA